MTVQSDDGPSDSDARDNRTGAGWCARKIRNRRSSVVAAKKGFLREGVFSGSGCRTVQGYGRKLFSECALKCMR